jgi:hypothetical protein
MVVALARPAERGALLGTVYSVAYLSFSLPAVVAGIATTAVGLRATSIVYGAGVAVVALLAVAISRLSGDPTRGTARVLGSAASGD